MLAQPLMRAVDGKKTLELGVPPTADVGDVLQSLFALYPRLAQHICTEQKVDPRSLGAVMASTSRGKTLYLFAPRGNRLELLEGR